MRLRHRHRVLVHSRRRCCRKSLPSAIVHAVPELGLRDIYRAYSLGCGQKRLIDRGLGS